MKRLALALALGLAGVAGVAIPQAADARIVYIDDGDVVYRNGRPYLRTTREPVMVEYYRGGPRYYRTVQRYRYPSPRYSIRYRTEYLDGYDDDMYWDGYRWRHYGDRNVRYRTVYRRW